MEFRFNLNEVFRTPIVEVGQTLIPSDFKGDRRGLWTALSKITDVINAMGTASAAAQNLTRPITTADRLRNSVQQQVYLMIDHDAFNGKGAVTGMLKTGKKGLYIFDREGHHYHVESPCVLDFYIHESRQRSGYGKQLFEYMLQKEKVHPEKLAIDRPSEKFLGFLNKHYNLNNPIRQMNNYVVYDGFFPQVCDKSDKSPVNNSGDSVSKRGSNGLQAQIVTSPYGRYGAPRPPCSMGQIIHNQSAAMPVQEPTGELINVANAGYPPYQQNNSIQEAVSAQVNYAGHQTVGGGSGTVEGNTGKEYHWPFVRPSLEYAPQMKNNQSSSTMYDLLQPGLQGRPKTTPVKIPIDEQGRPQQMPTQKVNHHILHRQDSQMSNSTLYQKNKALQANRVVDDSGAARFNHFSQPSKEPNEVGGMLSLPEDQQYTNLYQQWNNNNNLDSEGAGYYDQQWGQNNPISNRQSRQNIHADLQQNQHHQQAMNSFQQQQNVPPPMNHNQGQYNLQPMNQQVNVHGIAQNLHAMNQQPHQMSQQHMQAMNQQQAIHHHNQQLQRNLQNQQAMNMQQNVQAVNQQQQRNLQEMNQQNMQAINYQHQEQLPNLQVMNQPSLGAMDSSQQQGQQAIDQQQHLPAMDSNQQQNFQAINQQQHLPALDSNQQQVQQQNLQAINQQQHLQANSYQQQPQPNLQHLPAMDSNQQQNFQAINQQQHLPALDSNQQQAQQNLQAINQQQHLQANSYQQQQPQQAINLQKLHRDQQQNLQPMSHLHEQQSAIQQQNVQPINHYYQPPQNWQAVHQQQQEFNQQQANLEQLNSSPQFTQQVMQGQHQPSLQSSVQDNQNYVQNQQPQRNNQIYQPHTENIQGHQQHYQHLESYQKSPEMENQYYDTAPYHQPPLRKMEPLQPVFTQNTPQIQQIERGPIMQQPPSAQMGQIKRQPVHYQAVPTQNQPVLYQAASTASQPVQNQAVSTESRPGLYQPTPTSSQPVQYQAVPTESQPVMYQPTPTASQPVQYQAVPTESQPVMYQPAQTASQPVQYQAVPAADEGQKEVNQTDQSKIKQTPHIHSYGDFARDDVQLNNGLQLEKITPGEVFMKIAAQDERLLPAEPFHRTPSSYRANSVKQRGSAVRNQIEEPRSGIVLEQQQYKKTPTPICPLDRNISAAIQRSKMAASKVFERQSQIYCGEQAVVSEKKKQSKPGMKSESRGGTQTPSKLELQETPQPKLDRPQTLSLQTSSDDHLQAQSEVHEIIVANSELDNVENDFMRIEVSPRPPAAAEDGVGGDEEPQARKTPSHLTDQGYFDLKFYHNKLW